jgi:hypothetical protein
LIAVCLLVASCTLFPSQKRELKREVFIVTNGAQNIKLALVEVRVIPEADMNVFISHKQTAVDKERPDLQTSYEIADSEYQTARVAADQADAQYRASLQTEKQAGARWMQFESQDDFVRLTDMAIGAFDIYQAASRPSEANSSTIEEQKPFLLLSK